MVSNGDGSPLSVHTQSVYHRMNPALTCKRESYLPCLSQHWVLWPWLTKNTSYYRAKVCEWFAFFIKISGCSNQNLTSCHLHLDPLSEQEQKNHRAPDGSEDWGSSIVTAVAWVQLPAWEIPQVMGMVKKTKKEKKKKSKKMKSSGAEWKHPQTSTPNSGLRFVCWVVIYVFTLFSLSLQPWIHF